MEKRRVVVTGMAGVTAFGNEKEEVFASLKKGENAVRYMSDWREYEGLHTNLAAPILNFELPDHYGRVVTRSMGPVSKMATYCSELALQDAGLLGNDILTSGDTGVAYGSSTGSTEPVVSFTSMMTNKQVKGITATTYIKMMPHTTAVNISLFFGTKGRIIPTSTACTSGSQGIGYGYEAIVNGHQTVMICGGAEELCPSEAAVFDTLFATSTLNDTPKLTPKPYDRNRDGLVLGEGAGTLVLEEYEFAKKRGAPIYAEVVGFATNSDAQHITQPCKESMERVMRMSLNSAGLKSENIGYINGHGTATERGDLAESKATEKVFGHKTPFSTVKSYFGHTLGACGAIEAWLSIEMMNRGWYCPTINLLEVDPECGELDYIMGKGREFDSSHVMSNNFAFGGINTSLIFKKYGS